mmetsp:Transcript_14316/g.49554  ORF Transcript_14316/g.49554 Transcript_14316/m.49554 type:complete len:278 (-) Transcript_14316:84-917(-)
MQKVVLALVLGAARAFVAPAAPSAPTAVAGAREELINLAESNTDALGKNIGFWDPLGATKLDFFGLELAGRLPEGATIGYLRHAEIKHGRVSMAGFLGFCAQSTPFVSGTHNFPVRFDRVNSFVELPPYRGYVPNVTPQEQWDNMPLIAKLQIFTLIGLLESYGEGAGQPEGYVHYTKGGVPGYYPPIKGRVGGQILFNLWDPFTLPGGPSSMTPERKARGLKSELLNGRAAQMGILGLLSESAVPGSVPFLSGVEGFPRYAGEVMAPFSHDFHLFQ